MDYQSISAAQTAQSNDTALLRKLLVLDDDAPVNHIPGGYVHYIDHLGSDLSVVNAARVSMNKWHDVFDAEADAKLIRYLVRNHHTSPFRHCFITIRCRMPITVERQYFKHRIGVEINSISGRYVQFDEEYATPLALRKGSKSIKQGSLDETVDQHEEALAVYRETCDAAFAGYQRLLALGVCKEQARMVLPQALFTEFICTMSLQAAAHFYFLRADSHAQREIQWYAHKIGQLCSVLYPVSWAALTEVDHD